MNTTSKLSQYLEKIESAIPKFEEKKLSVSNSTVGWQIDHTLKAINKVLGGLKNAPKDKKAKPTLLGRFCLLFRYIPRGKGKAPKEALPPENITENSLLDQLSSANEVIQQIPNIPIEVTFKHLYFGILTKKQTIKFLEVHTKHHLKIIDDILK